MEELNINQMKETAGGYVVEDKKANKFWIVRQNGTVIAPAPDRETAIQFAKQFNESATVLSMEEYKLKFGRELQW